MYRTLSTHDVSIAHFDRFLALAPALTLTAAQAPRSRCINILECLVDDLRLAVIVIGGIFTVNVEKQVFLVVRYLQIYLAQVMVAVRTIL